MLFNIICIVLVAVFFLYVLSYYTGQAYLRGFDDASSGFLLAIQKIVIPVSIVERDEIFYVYDADNNFITQADSIEKVQENLSIDKKKAYIVSKILPGS